MQFSSLFGHIQELLGTIRASGKPADSLIDSFFRSHKYLGSHDRRFIAETVYGTLRHLRWCEFVLHAAIGREVPQIKSEDGLLLLAVTYVLAISRQRVAPADIAAKLGSPVLKKRLPELLADIATTQSITTDDTIERIGIEHSFQEWMVRRLRDDFGQDTAEHICKSLNEPAPLTLRVNLLKVTVEQCRKVLGEEKVETTSTRISPFGLHITKRLNVFSLKAFQDGLFEVQDEGSQILPLMIDPKPTAKVLDACAGAGGKSLGFAVLMKNRGEIYAVDTNGYRLRELKKRSRRAGAFNIRPVEVHTIEDLTDKFRGYFDIVFVDAPCSGLGTIRRNPGLKWTVTQETVQELAEKQSAILQQCASLVKPGGKLAYATCTLLKEENEDVVHRFREKNREFSLVNPEEMLKKIGVEKGTSGDFVTLLPHIHGTDGFFCAVMEKSV